MTAAITVLVVLALALVVVLRRRHVREVALDSFESGPRDHDGLTVEVKRTPRRRGRRILEWEVDRASWPAFSEAFERLLHEGSPTAAFAAFNRLLEQADGAGRASVLRDAVGHPGLRRKALEVVVEERLLELLPWLRGHYEAGGLSEWEELDLIGVFEALGDDLAEPALIVRLRDDHEPVALRAARALESLGSGISVPHLRELAEGPGGSRALREQAKESLAQIRFRMSQIARRLERAMAEGHDGIDEVRRIARNDEAELRVRAAALEHLAGLLDRSAALDLCREVLVAEEEGAARLVLPALRRLRHPQAVPLLVSALAQAGPETRVEIARAIGAIESEGSERALIGLLYDEVEAIKVAAIEALGRVGGATALRALDPLDGLRYLGAVRSAARHAREAIRERHNAGGLAVSEPAPAGQLSLARGGGSLSLPQTGPVDPTEDEAPSLSVSPSAREVVE